MLRSLISRSHTVLNKLCSARSCSCSSDAGGGIKVRALPPPPPTVTAAHHHRSTMASTSPSGDLSPARLWSDLCLAAPTVLSARSLRPDGSLISSSWSQRDVVASKKRTFSLTYARTSSGYFPTIPVQTPKCIDFLSPSGRRLIRFVTKPGDNPNPATEVEVWTVASAEGDPTYMDAVWTVPASVHGPVFSDEWFGGVAWSPDERLFVYVADRPHVAPGDGDGEAAATSATGARPKQPKRPPGERWMDACRAKYSQDARDVLGEAYVGQRAPALFLGDVVGAECRAMCVPADEEEPELDDETSHLYGDPQWSPDGKWIAVTRRPSALRAPCLEDDNVSDVEAALGVRYCYNRYSSVELMCAPRGVEDAEKATLSLTPVTDHGDFDDFCCSSPRFSPDSRTLVYVSAPRKAEGRAESSVLPHNTTKVLRAMRVLESDGDPATSAPVTIVGVVRSAERDAFPGLYMHALPSQPWVAGGGSVLLSSLWGSENRVLQVPIVVDGDGGENSAVRVVAEGDVRDVTPAFPASSCAQSVSVADVCEAGAVLIHSSPIHPHQISFLPLTVGGVGGPSGGALVATPVSSLSRRAKALDDLVRPFASVDLVERPVKIPGSVDAGLAAKEFMPGTDDRSRRFQVTLLVPQSASEGDGRAPLIVYPHGGPHSASVNGFSAGVAAMLLSGFAVMHVNFRGSLGLGQDSLESLPGRAGVQDVSEVLQATQWALQTAETAKYLDAQKVGYVGGSHGGFLGAHCSVVKGNLYKAVALRNPVCNIASMANVSDIPEWTYCETGVPAISAKTGLALSPDPDAFAAMWRASPVSRVVKNGTRPGRTILFVGAGDRRVPPEQSIEWQRLITGAHEAGIVTLRWYPESGHAIDEVAAGDDVWVHTLELFSEM